MLLLVSSTIIEHVDAMRRSGFATLAFFYCDFREDQKKDRRGLLSSVLFQLSNQSNSYCDILSDFYSTSHRDAPNPSDDGLLRCLKEMLRLSGQAPVYLIVDALDECPNTSALPSPRKKVLMLIEELIKLQLPNLRICLTSRPEADIKLVLDPMTSHSISLHDQQGQMQDIDSYVRSVINTNPKSRRWEAKNKKLVIDVLTQKAGGV